MLIHYNIMFLNVVQARSSRGKDFGKINSSQQLAGKFKNFVVFC